MDILYVVGNGSKWGNNELRYSLRSIDKNGINVGRIFIASEVLPPFVNRETVTHVPVCDPTNIKHLNIMKKVEHTMRNSDIDDNFLLSSDDHFYIKPTDFDNYPLYHKGDIREKLSSQEYWVSLRDTKAFLKQHGLTTYATNGHWNTHFNRPLYMENIALFNAGKKLRYCAEVNCLMGNLLVTSGVKPIEVRDVKIKHVGSIADAIAKIRDSHFFSINDRAFECGIQEYLQQLFPNPSRWEK